MQFDVLSYFIAILFWFAQVLLFLGAAYVAVIDWLFLPVPNDTWLVL